MDCGPFSAPDDCPLRVDLRLRDLITSDAQVRAEAAPAEVAPVHLADGSSLAIVVRKSEHPKCVRCWHRRPDVGSHHEHPELCGRCVDNVAGAGENRRFA